MNLRPYQVDAVNAVSNALKSNARVGAVLPTGSGKSLIETALIDLQCDELTFNQVVLVVCHISDVVDQLHLTYCTHGRYGKNAMRLTSRIKPKFSTKVVFCTVQMLISSGSRKWWTSDPMRKDVACVLIDEAHQLGCDSYDILNDDLFPLARYVGFSATPYRKNLYSFSQFDCVPYAIDSKTLIEQGYLIPPRLFALNMESMSSAERYAYVVKIWKEKEFDRKLVSVVYLRTKAEAQEMRLVAEEAGIVVEYVSGESTESFCRDLYIRARQGSVDMIVNVRKLETGIDIPNIGSIFMPYGTNSVVTYLQRIGRALRPYLGKAEAHIYVFGDSPSIQAGKWQRLQRDALEARDPLDPLQTLEDDLEQLIEECAPAERIAWTRDAVKACEMLIAGNMRSVAELIAEKRFPDKYSKAISRIVPLIGANADGERKPPSEAQISDLVDKHRFRHQDVSTLSSQEAGAILGALRTYFSRDPFVLQQGPHAGKHISDTPSMYRRFLKDPSNKALWLRWVRAGKPAEGAKA